MTAGRAVLAALLVWTVLLAGPAFGQTFPALSGRVVDQAGILSPAVEAQLTERSAALEARTGAQLVVATVSSLQDYEIADYANRLFRAWGLGQREKNNGVLFLTAPNERAVRVEVGYGLEPVLTDAYSALLIHRRVLPRFREGDMEGGIVQGVDGLVEQLGLDPAAAQARAVQAETQRARRAERTEGGAGGIVITLLILWFVFAALSSFGRRGRRYRRRRGGGVAGDVAQVILWSMLTNSGGRSRHRGGGWGGGGFGGGGFGGGGGSSGGGGASGSW